MTGQISRRSIIQSGLVLATIPVRPLFTDSNDYDVVIIGAGLAGLKAADELMKKGLNVKLLEASERAGGRLHTLFDLDGAPDVGGVQVGKGYETFRAVAANFKLAFSPVSAGYPGTSYLVNKHLNTADQWPLSSANQLPESERETLPSRLLYQYLKPELENRTAVDWYHSDNQDLDVALAAFLRRKGASSETIRLIAANLNAIDIQTLSALDVFKRYKSALSGSRGSDKIIGGNALLPLRLAEQLGHRLELNKVVSKIASKNGVLSVHCEDGQQLTAKRCIISIPFSTLRDIQLKLPLSDSKQAAIRTLAYTKVTIVLLKPKSEFWQQDGLPPNMWTDTALGRVFTEVDENDRVNRLRVFIMGAAAEKLQAVPDCEVGRLCLELLGRYRPSSHGELELESVYSWGRNRFFKGAFSHYLAGDVFEFSNTIGNSEGLLHFAGEHTERDYVGIEAAMQSGLRAAQEVVAHL